MGPWKRLDPHRNTLVAYDLASDLTVVVQHQESAAGRGWWAWVAWRGKQRIAGNVHERLRDAKRAARAWVDSRGR